MAKAAKSAGASGGPLESYFNLTANGTTVRTEVLAGITTFLTMAYIIFVNPSILSAAGMPKEAVFVATCLAAAIATLIMGLYAKYPIALAPGMGLNAFFAFAVVGAMGFTWQQALAAVLVSGVLALIISILPIRAWLVNSIPMSLKMATSAGIGFFLAIIALSGAGIVVDSPATLVTHGTFLAAAPILCLLGFIIIAALNQLKIPGATIIGILAVSVIGIPLGVASFGGIFAMPPSLAPTFLQLDFSRVAEGLFWIAALTMFFVDFFDTAGTLVGVSHRAGLLDKDGNIPRLQQALVADSSATAIGSLLGTSNTTSYIESAAGVSAGGRTGLASVVTAICFLLALFLQPLAGSIPQYATAAALLFVAVVMAQALREVDWDDLTEAAPAAITAVTMPLTYSIAVGLGLGFITYVVVKVLTGRASEISVPVWLLAIIFAIMLPLLKLP
ncbi:transporter [Terrihabitans soli]|uniref:Transporter n=1 Tax=Terrihabitans soli TaxID=708113 RepID=A0A6S6QYH8_9HYPH|nr:NCS2 family permease [Terrihabitans soli]BCJ91638.1 transporter [Terrihabitans soli]